MSTGKRKPETSGVWKYFTKTSNIDNHAVCNFCGTRISRGGKNASVKGFSTSNLWNHLKSLHWEEVEIQQSSFDSSPPIKKQVIIAQAFESASMKYDIDDLRSKEITRLIAEEICVDMEPLSHVNKIGFQRLLEKLYPRYQMISTTYLTQDVLPDIYARVKSKIKIKLNNISNLCITSDFWSSDSLSTTNDFITVTAHGLNKDFILENFVLEVKPFEGEVHSEVVISQNVVQILNDWGIGNKVQIAVTDNAQNMVNAISSIHNIDHFPCLAHSLQLVLQDALFEDSEIKNMVGIVRKIVGHFNHSAHAQKKLREAQEEHNVPLHVFIQDVSTRWDSTYLMLNKLNEQRIAIQTVLPKLDIPPSCDLTNHQWVLLEELLKILQYYYDVTKALSEDNVTLADAIPLTNSLFKAIDDVSSENPTFNVLKEKIKQKLNERLGDLEENENCILATALDPRYKCRVFRNRNTITKVMALLYTNLEKMPDCLGNEEPSSSSAGPSTTNSGIWNKCQEIIESIKCEEPLIIDAKSAWKQETDDYITSPNMEHSSNPFQFWNSCYSFSRLKVLASKYLSYKPSSINSERLFSTARLLQTPDRILNPENLQMLCFLNKNLTALNFDY